MKIFLSCFLMAISISLAVAQKSMLWQKTYGGTGHEYAWETISTSDGGFAFVGFSQSSDGDVTANHGANDLWVAKLDASRNIQWSFLYGGTDDDYGYGIVQTADGGFMVTGYTDSFDGDVTGHHGTYGSDVWVLKLTASGSLTWAKCYGGSSDDEAVAIVKSASGNFYTTGSTYSTDGDVSGNHGTSQDIWVLKMNASGNIMNSKCLGGTNTEESMDITLTNDNGCVLTGRAYSSDGDVNNYHGGSDMWVAKIDSSLSLQWSLCLGGTETEEGNSIVQLPDNSYMALGYTSTQNNGDVTGHHAPQGMDDFWLIHITASGTLDWAKCYGGSGDDQANGLIRMSNGNLVMCGLTNSTDGDVTGFHTSMFNPDIWAAAVNPSGTLQWQGCYGGSDQDESFNIIGSGSNCLITGFTYSTDYDVTVNHGSADGWLLLVSGSSSTEENFDDKKIAIFPNPANNHVYVDAGENYHIRIYDAASRVVFEETEVKSGWLELPEDMEGLYSIVLIMKNCVAIKKLSVIR